MSSVHVSTYGPDKYTRVPQMVITIESEHRRRKDRDSCIAWVERCGFAIEMRSEDAVGMARAILCLAGKRREKGLRPTLERRGGRSLAWKAIETGTATLIAPSLFTCSRINHAVRNEQVKRNRRRRSPMAAAFRPDLRKPGCWTRGAN